jgi:hypothetical protein
MNLWIPVRDPMQTATCMDKARGTTHRMTDRIRTRRIHHPLDADREAGRWMRFAYPPYGRWVYGRCCDSTS